MDLEALTRYCEGVSLPKAAILQELERETNLKTLKPRMLSGHLQGNVLYFLVQISGAKHILEIGTFTGYATLAMAYALSPDGHITTIEANPELGFISDKYFKKSGLSTQIHQIFGDAKEEVNKLSGPFDLVFIDAGKKDNAYYYEAVLPKVKSGGLILVDNVLWSGKVLDDPMDKHTQIIHDFNTQMSADSRVESLYLPMRDGLAIFRKK
jgi:predicted O-methyltransferase YrrM